MAIDNGQGIAYTECTEGAANKRLAPYSNYLKRSNRWFGKAGRLLLFIRLNEQLANANDNKAKLENFGCTHLQPPFLEIRGSEAPLTTQGTNRLPFFGSTAVIINHFLALCKA